SKRHAGGMEMRRSILLTASIFLLSTVCSAQGKKERSWQMGHVVSLYGSSAQTGTTGSATGTVVGSTVIVNSQSSPTYAVWQNYVIDVGEYRYIADQRLRWRWSKPVPLIVNDSVQVAIEKNHMFLIGTDGKEYEIDIKQVIRLKKN